MMRRGLFLATATLAMIFRSGVALPQADTATCLADGATCSPVTCPVSCCSGVPMRSSGSLRYCPTSTAAATTESLYDRRGPLMNPPSAPVAPLSSSTTAMAWDPTTGTTSSATAATATTEAPTTAPPPVEEVVTPAPAAAQVAPPPAPTPAPSPSVRSGAVDALQSTTTLKSGQQSSSATGSVLMIVGAVAGIACVVVAVMFKRRQNADTFSKPVKSPGSSYIDTANSGYTPDTRSLDGMMEGGVRATTESMKMLPVLSLASRQEAQPVRVSSPFTQRGPRISSPAHVGEPVEEDYAFEVDARPGSSVQVVASRQTNDPEGAQGGMWL